LKSFRVEPGFNLEIVAAEPLVTDAVAMEWDENGRLFVCEMWNYPGNPQPGEPLGRVRMLEDTDGDAKYDKATIFADNLKWPSGVFPWDGGVFVISSPDIWYLKDTNADVPSLRCYSKTGPPTARPSATKRSRHSAPSRTIAGPIRCNRERSYHPEHD
jgi:putative membrane-bound dehydrogenase-like protein